MKINKVSQLKIGHITRIYSLLLSFLLVFIQTAYSHEPNKVKIISHSKADNVGSREQVTVYANINDDSHVWVLVHLALLPDLWWPQHKATFDPDGNWRSLVFFGKKDDVGYDFEIAVATFSGEEEQKILDYHKRGIEYNDYKPIKFPVPTSNVDIVTVRKTSH